MDEFKDGFLTVKEVCKLLRISRLTVYSLIREGILPGFKPTKRLTSKWLIPKEAIYKLVERK